MEEFPSGQRGQTVNLLRFASVVRIHPPPPTRRKRVSLATIFMLCVKVQPPFLLLLLAFGPDALRWIPVRVHCFMAVLFDFGKHREFHGCSTWTFQMGPLFFSGNGRRLLSGGTAVGQSGLGGRHRLLGGGGPAEERAVNRTYVLFTALLYRETASLSRGNLEVSEKLCLP